MDIVIQKNADGAWSASGEGPMRQIVAEGVTRVEAEQAFNHVYGSQYAEQETLTALSLGGSHASHEHQ